MFYRDVVCMQTRARTHTYTMEYYLAIKKNEILPFATTWMELEGVMRVSC